MGDRHHGDNLRRFPIVQEATLPVIAHTLDHSEVEPSNRPGSLESHAKRQRTDVCTNRLYERAISFKNTLTDPEMDQAKWGRALEKLYTVMVSGPNSCPKSISFIAGDVEKNLRQIRLLCGARSPNTIAKRAHSLLQFCLWHRGFYYRKHPHTVHPRRSCRLRMGEASRWDDVHWVDLICRSSAFWHTCVGAPSGEP